MQDYAVVDPLNDIRDIPPEVINDINSFNKTIRLDAKLSENRDPDFLLLLMNSCQVGEGLGWIIKLVEQNETFDRLPVQVLAEYAINTVNRPEDNALTTRQKLLQKTGTKSSSAAREQKIIEFLCNIATEPGEGQIRVGHGFFPITRLFHRWKIARLSHLSYLKKNNFNGLSAEEVVVQFFDFLTLNRVFGIS